MVENANERTTPVNETVEQNEANNEAREDVINKTSAELESQQTKISTQIESNKLQLEVKLDNLLDKYKKLAKDVQRLSGNNPTKKHFEEVLKDCIKDIKTMKKNVAKNKSGTDFKILEDRVSQMETIYAEYQDNYQYLILWREDITIRSFIDSKQDAKREVEHQQLERKNQAKINTLLNDAAAESLKNRDQKEYQRYLVDVINGNVRPDTHPFYKDNEVNFNIIKNTNPNFYDQIVPQWNTVAYDVYVQNTPWQRVACRNKPKNFAETLWDSFADLAEKMGINKEKDPRKRRAWENVWKLAWIWWAIFLWFNFLKNLFSSSKTNENKWRDTALYWAWLLGLMNFGWIKNWFQDITWLHPGEQAAAAETLANQWWLNQNEIWKRFVDSPVTVLSALSFIPIKSWKEWKIIEEKHNKLEFNKDNYMVYINTLALSWKLSADELANLEKAADKLKDSEFLWDWLAAFGIKDMKKIDDLSSNPDMTMKDCTEVQSSYRKHIESMTNWVHADLYKQWLVAKDVNALEKISHSYNEKESLDTQIIQWIKDWLLSSTSKEWYDLSQLINDPRLNIEWKTLKWFKKADWAEIKFDTYDDLFCTLMLTNSIMDIFKWKTAVEKEPFYVSWQDWKIRFNNNERYNLLDHDIGVLKKDTIKKWFDCVSKNKDEYVKYLNQLRAEK